MLENSERGHVVIAGGSEFPGASLATYLEFEQCLLPAQRGVVFRTSFVIGRNRGDGGGALSRLLMLVGLGWGGTLDSGTHGMSWIHETDFNRLVRKSRVATGIRENAAMRCNGAVRVTGVFLNGPCRRTLTQANRPRTCIVWPICRFKATS